MKVKVVFEIKAQVTGHSKDGRLDLMEYAWETVVVDVPTSAVEAAISQRVRTMESIPGIEFIGPVVISCTGKQ